MLYRRFGRTDLQIPVFSCGGMRYQYKWQDMPFSSIPDENQENLVATINRSLSLGINHIETARFYGTSEIQLGQILPKIERDRLIVQTKVTPDPDPLVFKKNFDQSLSNLGLDYVDLLGIHGINNQETYDQTFREGGCWEMAKTFQREGKVRFIGFSTHGPTDIICKTIETNKFDYVNLHWYYINQSNWPAILTATKYDLGVFIISPANKGGMLYQPSQRLIEICHPISPLVFNNIFCLSHSQIDTLSVGAAKPSDFDEHLKALDLLDQADEILPPIMERFQEEAIKKLGEDWYKTWDVGLPSYEDTPGNINIHSILWLRNLAIAYDMIDYGKMRYNLLGNGGHWFPGQRADRVHELDLSACLVNSPHKDKIPSILAQADELLGGEPVKRLSQS